MIVITYRYSYFCKLQLCQPILLSDFPIVTAVTLSHIILYLLRSANIYNWFSFHSSRLSIHILRPCYDRSEWAGWCSRYSDWQHAGRSEDRIPVWARFSAPVQTGPGAHPPSCTTGTGSFPGVKSSRGVTLTPHSLLVPRSPTGRMAYTEPQCLYKGALYLYDRSSCLNSLRNRRANTFTYSLHASTYVPHITA